ncbi:LysR family transcriptional regulator, partial [Bradyrhizobium sp.]|uniref:helix-turn-helix domain-containing protein n=1 Tax=Bradyrhizobium sp. TaxID=376 RepID=UPI00391DAB56
MAILLAATADGPNAIGRTSKNATAPPIQQTPIPHFWPSVWEVFPSMSSGQHSSIDMSPAPAIVMFAFMPPDGMACAAADAPSGTIASEMAIMNASMARTSRMETLLPFGQQPASEYHISRPDAVIDPGQAFVTVAGRLSVQPRRCGHHPETAMQPDHRAPVSVRLHAPARHFIAKQSPLPLTRTWEGSLAGAGRKLGRSSAAVSRAISFLENQVGAELLHRTTRSIRL